MAEQMLEMWYKRGQMAKDCEVSPEHIPAANVEIVGTWRSFVVRNRINKSREEAIADVKGNLEENETAYGR